MFEIVEIQGKPWVPADDLAGLLEYSTTKTLIDVYRKNSDEFAENDVLVVTGAIRAENTERGRPSRTTYFSQSGGVLLCMFARTPKAKEARKLIGEGFLQWFNQKIEHPRLVDSPFGKVVDISASIVDDVPPPSQTPLFVQPSSPEYQGVLQLQTPQGVQSFNVVSAALPAHGPVAPQLGYSGDEPPTAPKFLYDFAKACRGMHGWYLAEHIADVVGCSLKTAHDRARRNGLPAGWTSAVKQRKVWVYIP